MRRLTLLPVIIVLILISITGLSNSAFVCSGQVTQNVPAVVGSGGGIVNVSMELIPGHGNIYVEVFPRTGVATQESIEKAIVFGAAIAKKDISECDLLVKFNTKQTNYVDGPSAGTALTVMAYALVENRSMRYDTIVTGTIENDGRVGIVGGLYEKAIGASAFGAKYFVTPTENLYEVLLLKDISKKYGLSILQAKKVEDVIGFMVYGNEIPQDSVSFRLREVPKLPIYEKESDIRYFEGTALGMLDAENLLIESIADSDSQTSELKEFFRNELNRQKAIIDQGYLFSAANEAFLNIIDIETIKAMISQNSNLNQRKTEIEKCLQDIKRPGISDKNFEWVFGSDQRREWAYDKLNRTNTTEKLLAEEKYAKYNELMYSHAWCTVAKQLVANSPTNGTAFNENELIGIAVAKLNEADSLGSTSDDTKSRLGIAHKEFESGKYGASIFDSVYVIENERLTRDSGSNGKKGKANASTIREMIDENLTSMWGQIYQSHAAFLYNQNQTEGAYRTIRFAKGLEAATSEMDAVIKKQISTTSSEDNVKADTTDMLAKQKSGDLIVLAFLFLLIISIIVVFISGRANGRNGKRTGKAYRIKQKEG